MFFIEMAHRRFVDMTWHGLNVGSLSKRNQHSFHGNQLFKEPRVRAQARDTRLLNPCLDHVEIYFMV